MICRVDFRFCHRDFSVAIILLWSLLVQHGLLEFLISSVGDYTFTPCVGSLTSTGIDTV